MQLICSKITGVDVHMKELEHKGQCMLMIRLNTYGVSDSVFPVTTQYNIHCNMKYHHNLCNETITSPQHTIIVTGVRKTITIQ